MYMYAYKGILDSTHVHTMYTQEKHICTNHHNYTHTHTAAILVIELEYSGVSPQGYIST